MSDNEGGRRLKISLFGFEKSGKTCLFDLWINKQCPKDYLKTTEMEFENVTLSVDGLDVPILLCDWGYEEFMTCSTSQQTALNVYTENTDLQVFVLAHDSIESYEFLEGAPNSVFFKKAGEVQQVAIMNKIDLEEAPGIKEKAQSFSKENEIPMYEVTTKKSELCKQIFEEIIKLYLENNPQFKQKLSPSKKNVKSNHQSPQTTPRPIQNQKVLCCSIL